MRDKLLTHGARIFDTYELLEMLLYHVIPYKDTNPIAKSLLRRFGGIDGVLSASAEELTEVNGIGDRVAEFIAAVNLVGLSMQSGKENARVFNDYGDTGRYLCDYFKNNTDVNVAMISLDNSMRFLDLSPIRGAGFGSGSLGSKAFIDAAIRCRATYVMLASTHRHGPLFPLESDRETEKMVFRELARVGVKVVEHYIVTGNKFVGTKSDLLLRFSNASDELARFIDSREREAKCNEE